MEDKMSFFPGNFPSEGLPPSASSLRWPDCEEIPHTLDGSDLVDLPDLLQNCYDRSKDSFHPKTLCDGQNKPSSRDHNVQNSLWETDSQVTGSLRGPGFLQDNRISVTPMYSWQHFPVNDGIREDCNNGSNSTQREDTQLEDGLQDPAEVSAVVHDQLTIDDYLNIDTPKQGPPASDMVSTNAFRSITVDDEEERKQLLGTIFETDFPDIPDIFLNEYDYAETHPRHEEFHRGDYLNPDTRLDPIWDTPSPVDKSSETTRFDSIGHDEFKEWKEYSDFEQDMLRFRSATPDIVSELGYMPFSSMNTFLYEEDTKHFNADSTLGHESRSSTDPIGSQMDRLEGSYPKGDTIIRDSCQLEISRNEVLHESKSDSEEVYGIASSSQAFASSRDQNFEEKRHQSALDLIQLPVSPAGLSPSVVREHDDGRFEDSAVQNIDHGEGSPLTEKVMAKDRGKHSDQKALCDLTNADFVGEKDRFDSVGGRATFRSGSMEEICRRVSELNKKMTKHRGNRGKGLVNLKYYSLKRMEKDLSDHLILSQQLFVAAVRLRDERRKLDRACEKEREEIRSLHDRMGL